MGGSALAQAPAVPSPAAPAPAAATPGGAYIRGNDRVVANPRQGPIPEGTANSFRFEDAPMSDVVHVIMRDILRADYVVHTQLAGNITLATRGDVPADQAVYMLETALQANGIAMARDARGVYHIGRPEALVGIVAAPRIAANGVLPPGTGTVIIPLQYIGAGEMAAILRPLLPPTALVRVDPLRNLLVLAGSRSQAEGWLDIVSTFDVDLLKGMSVAIVPLKYASVREVDAALRSMAGGLPAAAPPTTTLRPAGPGGATAASAAAAAAQAQQAAEASSLFGAIRVLPIERINSLLLVSPRAAYLEEARAWIERLDRPGSSALEPQLYIYPVRNGSAKHLAEVLSGVFGGDRTTTTTTTPSVAPGLSATTGGTGGAGAINSLAGAGANAQPNAQSRVGSVTTTAQGARVIADELNNAILIYALAGEYAKIEAALRRLDVSPVQVLIEASIVEVTLGDDLQYGLQWYFTDKARSGLSGTGAISQTASSVLGNISPTVAQTAGFSYTLRNSLGAVQAVLNALAEKSLVKVISSPSVMVLDNHTAGIAVGNQTPIRSSETVTSGGNITQSITYKDTGVNLQVTPSVSAENVVTMAINQSVTDVGPPDTAATGQRSFLQRQIISKVAVRSGETLVLGGLIRDNDGSGNRGLPVLSEIPVVGGLFGAQSRNVSRTELLVVITPRVVRSDLDARDVGAELRERMKSFEGRDMLRKP
ncbi:type II secretion system protein GspD [Caenimonas sedimenti]|uniref:Type IV pilus biogenesis and competence protein PilQ n=2 Tax=Caenimonas sedimenti TaxID=2596921 RepID=A0A562ZW62_9BURK|nr:type II secretion system protein GspD [Caenimonas sedimenti]